MLKCLYDNSADITIIHDNTLQIRIMIIIVIMSGFLSHSHRRIACYKNIPSFLLGQIHLNGAQDLNSKILCCTTSRKMYLGRRQRQHGFSLKSLQWQFISVQFIQSLDKWASLHGFHSNLKKSSSRISLDFLVQSNAVFSHLNIS